MSNSLDPRGTRLSIRKPIANSDFPVGGGPDPFLPTGSARQRKSEAKPRQNTYPTHFEKYLLDYMEYS